MQFALVDNIKTEAAVGLKGVCQSCGSEMIAKCGQHKVNHWAHKGVRNCDPWWENETEWHRSWKNNFPKEWQEVVLTDEQTGEKHIADIRTEHGLVVEFQHSYINPLERAKREGFYKKMIWVADGTRLKRDCTRFLKGKEDFQHTGTAGVSRVYYAEECFPSSWLASSVPVVFDFLGAEIVDNPNDWRHHLYYLIPGGNARPLTVVTLSRQNFIDRVNCGALPFVLKEPTKAVAKQVVPNIPVRTRSQSYFLNKHGQFVKRRRF